MYKDTIYKNDFIIQLQEEVNNILNWQSCFIYYLVLNSSILNIIIYYYNSII
jgi:hypothetical protein